MTNIHPFWGLPRNHYGLIMADPPWNFRTFSGKGLEGRPQHYKRLTLPDIKALPVKDLAAKDCHLFLWTTGPHLQNAFDVIRAWGFTYSAVGFTWVKLNPRAPEMFMVKSDFFMGQGYTTRGNAEICLLAKRGKPKREAANIRELIVAPRRKHSEKPEEAFSRCQEYANGPYLEMFSRKDRLDWDVWGDEVGKLNHMKVAL